MLYLRVVYISSNKIGVINPFKLSIALISIITFIGIIFFSVRRWIEVILLVGYIVFFILEFTVFRR